MAVGDIRSASPSSAVAAAIEENSLLLIEHGERHEIRNTGRTALKTLNFYCPPGYTKDGNELPRAEP